MRAGGFPGNPGGLVVSILKTAGARAPAHQARGRGRRTWRPTERTAGARMVPPGEGNEARGDGRRGVGVSHSTAEAGELSPRDPVEGRGHRQVAPLEGKTANTPRLGPVSTSRQRIAELARQAVGMAVAIAWLPGPAGTRRRVAKLSVEEPDAAEPARPDLWGARVSNDPGLPDPQSNPHYHRWSSVKFFSHPLWVGCEPFKDLVGENCELYRGFLGDLIAWEDGVYGTSKSVFAAGACCAMRSCICRVRCGTRPIMR